MQPGLTSSTPINTISKSALSDGNVSVNSHIKAAINNVHQTAKYDENLRVVKITNLPSRSQSNYLKLNILSSYMDTDLL